MKFIELLRTAFQSLKTNRKRSFLTIIGIMIGIAAFITILGMGDGVKKTMYDKFGKQTDEYIRQRNYSDSLNAVNSAKQKAQTEELIRQNRALLNKKNN